MDEFQDKMLELMKWDDENTDDVSSTEYGMYNTITHSFVPEEDLYGYAVYCFLENKVDMDALIEQFPCIGENFTRSEFDICIPDDTKDEIIEWFYSGNWRKENYDNGTVWEAKPTYGRRTA